MTTANSNQQLMRALNLQTDDMSAMLEEMLKLKSTNMLLQELSAQQSDDAAQDATIEQLQQVVAYSQNLNVERCELVNGFSLFVNLNDPGYITQQIRDNHAYEPIETHFINTHLKAGDTFVDIGANIGYFSALATHIVGSTGRVIAVDPDPENIAILRLNQMLTDTPQVFEAMHMIAGNKNEQGYLYRSPVNYGDHRAFDALYEDNTCLQKVPVIEKCLDDALMNEPRIDFIKIDTQGFEIRIFEGMVELLKRFQPTILFELWPYGLRNAGHNPPDLIQLVQDSGYSIYEYEGEEAALTPFVYDASLFEGETNKTYLDLLAIKVPQPDQNKPLNYTTLQPFTVLDSFSFPGDPMLNLQGWQKLETDTERGISWRWTSAQEAQFSVLIDSTHDYKIAVNVVYALQQEIIDSFHIKVNGQMVELTSTPTSDGVYFEGTIPSRLLSSGDDMTQIACCVAKTISPHELNGSPDERQLGVSISQIEICPI